MVASSPHSSNEATHHDTPSTVLTAYSPETAQKRRDVGDLEANFNLLSIGSSGRGNSRINQGGDDVFLNAPTSAQSQLSPTAAEFTPATSKRVPTSHTSNTSAETLNGGVPIGHGSGFAQIHGRGVSSVGAVGDRYKNVDHSIRGMYELPIHHASRPSPVATGPSFDELAITKGVFTTDETLARILRIANIDPKTSFATLAHFFNNYDFPSLQAFNSAALRSRGEILLSFTDIRDARKAASQANMVDPFWRISFLTAKDHAALTHSANPSHISNYDGQLLVTFYYDGRSLNLPGLPMFDMMHETLCNFGAIKAIHSFPHQQGNVREFRIEYFDSRNAAVALGSLQTINIGNYIMTLESYTPDIYQAELLSVTGRSTIPASEYGSMIHYLQQGDSPIPRSPGHVGRFGTSGNNNQVIIGRISDGMDVRTTIMLRNIPNKIDQPMLKEILDETSHGCYDFMYLRIDFANNCNVGYAFINFTDALSIIPFARARAGQRWNRFGSDKVAEISYATIQGRDCLVQKFRNSSVMLEHPSFRPKLFLTGIGPDAGQEEKFPGPDNPSKMRRSVENAEHVGLFAPRQGQAHRDEQRRRRSQYDRGTTGAQYEAYELTRRDPALSPRGRLAYHHPRPQMVARPSPPPYAGPSTWYDRA